MAGGAGPQPKTVDWVTRPVLGRQPGSTRRRVCWLTLTYTVHVHAWQSSATGQEARGAVGYHSSRPRESFGSRIEWLLAHPFPSSPGAQTTLVHLCLSRCHTFRILRAVVPSRSDLVFAGSDQSNGERGALLQPASQPATPTAMATASHDHGHGSSSTGLRNSPGPTSRNATSTRSSTQQR